MESRYHIGETIESSRELNDSHYKFNQFLKNNHQLGFTRLHNNFTVFKTATTVAMKYSMCQLLKKYYKKTLTNILTK